jgi:hypothetical protein
MQLQENASPLASLLSMCRTQERNCRKRVDKRLLQYKEWIEKELKDNQAGRDIKETRFNTSKLEKYVEKWKRWADAIEGVIASQK